MNVLLLGADYYGTLAAARSYGRSGVGVAMADESRQARGLYSRHVKERLEHPPLSEPDRLLKWLVGYGDKHPGSLLYPTNDHLAWLFAAYRDRLDQSFLGYAPGESALITLLDKKRLYAACAEVGIDVPKTRAVGPFNSRAIADDLGWPVLIKPRAQVYLETGIKGFIARDARELDAELARFRQLVRYGSVITRHHPDIVEPIVQEYIAAAETNIFSVSGFVTKRGEIVTRAATKVLQRPRKVGIGLCFEGRPIDEALSRQVAALCMHVGYYGCFEAEFIVDRERRLLIDFNPRFFSQMGFDIARGLDLPMLVLHAARGDDARVDDLLSNAKAWRASGDEAYCHKAMLDFVLTLQGISGQMSRGDVEQWRRWYSDRRRTATDAVRDPDDRIPSLVDTARWLQHFAAHPRSFVRSFVLNR